MKKIRILFVAICGCISISTCKSQFYTIVKKEKIAVIHSVNEDSLKCKNPSANVKFTSGNKELPPPVLTPDFPSSPELETKRLQAVVQDSLRTDSIASSPTNPTMKELTSDSSSLNNRGSFFQRLFRKGRKKEKDYEAVLSDSLPSDLCGNKLLCPPLDTLILTSGFGYRQDPFTGKRKFHHGADYRTSCENVYVMMPGKITKIGYNKVLGNYVTLEHGDFTVTYAHLHTVAGNKGQLVKAGQSIGISGSTGRSTGEHLHIGVRFRNKSVDPHPLVNYIMEASRIIRPDD